MPHKARGTRDKILRNVDYALQHLDGAVHCLRLVDEEAGGRSPSVEEQLPMLVGALEALRGAMAAFREGL